MNLKFYNYDYPTKEGRLKRKRYILSGAVLLGASVGLYLRRKQKKGD